jgi:hypothetical protein
MFFMNREQDCMAAWDKVPSGWDEVKDEKGTSGV